MPLMISENEVSGVLCQIGDTTYEVGQVDIKKDNVTTTVWEAEGWYDENATPAENFTFTLLDDNTYSIGRNSNSTVYDIILPSVYRGKPVTQIKEFGFRLSSITSVVIPNSITVINRQAFAFISNLKFVKIPASVTTMGDNIFAGTTSGIVQIYCEAESQPSGWDSLWNNLDKPVIWGINNYTFTLDTETDTYLVSAADASTLSGELEIPSMYEGKTVDTISSFAGSGVTAIYYPASITRIFPSAFDGCTSLVEFSHYKIESQGSSSIQKIGEAAFMNCSALTHIFIPNTTTTISSYAFEGCSALTEIRIPTSVTIVGSKAFDNCNNLTINCYATEQPSGWASDWNPDNRPVTWGYTG